MDSNTFDEIAPHPQGSQSSAAADRARPADLTLWSKERPIWHFTPVFRDNLPLAAIVTAYILAIYAVHIMFGIHDRLRLEIYYDRFTRITIVFWAFFILLHIRNKSYRKYFDVQTMAGFATIFLLAPLFKSAFSSFKQTIPLIHPFSWDARLMRLDYLLHFGHDPWRLMEGLLKHPWVIRAIDFLYVFWFIFLVVSCLWMALTRRRYLRRLFLISTLLVWSLLGSGLGTIFSSAGPCYYSRVVSAENDPFAPLMLKLAEIHQTKALWALDNQEGLWEAYQKGSWLPFGGISAMPSIHLAMAMLYALLAFAVRKWLGFLFLGYLLVMQTGSVILGWHYAVDGYAGAVLALVTWYAVRRCLTEYSGQTLSNNIESVSISTFRQTNDI